MSVFFEDIFKNRQVLWVWKVQYLDTYKYKNYVLFFIYVYTLYKNKN